MCAQKAQVIKFDDLVKASPEDALSSQPPTFKDIVNRAFAGLPPQQPDANPDLLIAKGFIAQTFLKKLQPFLEHSFPGLVFNIGPPKDMERAMDKTRQKDKDLSANCDFSRAMGGLHDLEQISKAVELFGQRGFASLENADGKKLEFFICDVEDTFSYPDDTKKPGLRNLDIKIAVPMGNRSFHICEFQLIHEGARAAYRESHISMEAERLAYKRAAMIENALSITMDAVAITKQAEDTLTMLKEAIAESRPFSISEIDDNDDILAILQEIIDLNDMSAESLAEGHSILTDRRQMLEEQQSDLNKEYATNTTTGSLAREQRRKTNTEIAESLNLDALRKDRPTTVLKPARSMRFDEALAP